MFSLFHDSWNAFPTFAILDHTMTVRAKPWTLNSNSNTSSCDGNNATIDGFSGGSTTDFIQQLVDECGTLCDGCSGTVDSDGDGLADECDDCYNSQGDTNEDTVIDILDIVNVVNIILNGGINSPDYTECELSNANYNGDSLINVLDIIQIINAILGQGLNSLHVANTIPSYVALNTTDNDLHINISSSTEFTGVELSFYTDRLLDVIISSERSDIQVHSNVYNGIQKVLIFSIENIPFSSNDLKLSIEDGFMLSPNDMDIVVASSKGESLPVVHTAVEVKSFNVNNIYPNPFNPTTQLKYDVDKAGSLQISVYNILGQEVATLYDDHQVYGSHSITWDASNMSSGVYYILMSLNGQVENNKVILIK